MTKIAKLGFKHKREYKTFMLKFDFGKIIELNFKSKKIKLMKIFS